MSIVWAIERLTADDQVPGAELLDNRQLGLAEHRLGFGGRCFLVCRRWAM